MWRVGDEIQVYVTDDGPGVPIEDWESVFEPFVRIEGRGRPRGSGIGLFAARRLMNAMGGRDLPRAERLRRQPVRGGAARRLVDSAVGRPYTSGDIPSRRSPAMATAVGGANVTADQGSTTVWAWATSSGASAAAG